MHELDSLIFQEIYRYREGHHRWPTHVVIPYAMRHEVAPYWTIPLPHEMSPEDFLAKYIPDALPPDTNTVRVERYVDMIGLYPTPRAITRIPPLLGDMASI